MTEFGRDATLTPPPVVMAATIDADAVSVEGARGWRRRRLGRSSTMGISDGERSQSDARCIDAREIHARFFYPPRHVMMSEVTYPLDEWKWLVVSRARWVRRALKDMRRKWMQRKQFRCCFDDDRNNSKSVFLCVFCSEDGTYPIFANERA